MSFDPWIYWITAGILLYVSEIFVPGFVFLSLGTGAILTGVILSLLKGLTIHVQLITFAVITIVAYLNFRKFGKKLK